MNFKNKGFTLIEILLATSISAFIFACAAASFSQGMRVYAKLINASDDLDAAFFMDKITQDLKNGSEFSRVPFQTGAYSVSFATLRQEYTENEKSFSAKPSKVAYTLNPKTGEISRIFTDPYSQKEIKNEKLIEDVREFNLQVLPEGTTEFPRSVRVTLVLGHGQNLTISKLIDIPLNYAPAT